ncbi:hypothetical protein HDU87_002560 [Geranomyces variabilis]|uniref:Uncharacterized protein n=1 Tax=Geranomyces variabilis TaxID=109894 RepID=A0AAD5TRT3_9FUNG|nr:hypothetical protein HDU87_002560 [Geranomyces variabilis]
MDWPALTRAYVKTPREGRAPLFSALAAVSQDGGSQAALEAWDVVLTTMEQSLVSYFNAPAATTQTHAVAVITELLKPEGHAEFACVRLVSLAFRNLSYLDLVTNEEGPSPLDETPCLAYRKWLTSIEELLPACKAAGPQITAFLMLNYLLRFCALPVKDDAASRTLGTMERKLLQNAARLSPTVLTVPMAVIAAHVFTLFLDGTGSGDVSLKTVQKFLDSFFSVGKLQVSPETGKILSAAETSQWRKWLISYPLPKGDFKSSSTVRDMLFTDLIFTESAEIHVVSRTNGLYLHKAPAEAIGPHGAEVHQTWLRALSAATISTKNRTPQAFVGRMAVYSAILQDSLVTYVRPTCCTSASRLAVHLNLGQPAESNVITRCHDYAVHEFARILESFATSPARYAAVLKSLLQYLESSVTVANPHQVWTSISVATWKLLRKQFLKWPANLGDSLLLILFQCAEAVNPGPSALGPFGVPWQTAFIQAGVAQLNARIFVTLAGVSGSGSVPVLRFLEALDHSALNPHVHIVETTKLLELIATASPVSAIAALAPLNDKLTEDNLVRAQRVLVSMRAKIVKYPSLRNIYRAVADAVGSDVSNKRKRVDDDLSLTVADNALRAPHIYDKIPNGNIDVSLIVSTSLKQWRKAAQTLRPSAWDQAFYTTISQHYPSPDICYLDLIIAQSVKEWPSYTRKIFDQLIQLCQERGAMRFDRNISPFRTIIATFALRLPPSSMAATTDDLVCIAKELFLLYSEAEAEIRALVKPWIVACLYAATRKVSTLVFIWILRNVNVELGFDETAACVPRLTNAIGTFTDLASLPESKMLLQVLVPMLLSPDEGLARRLASKCGDNAIVLYCLERSKNVGRDLLIEAMQGPADEVMAAAFLELFSRIEDMIQNQAVKGRNVPFAAWFAEHFIEPLVQAPLRSKAEPCLATAVTTAIMRNGVWVQELTKASLSPIFRTWANAMTLAGKTNPRARVLMQAWTDAWETARSPFNWVRTAVKYKVVERDREDGSGFWQVVQGYWAKTIASLADSDVRPVFQAFITAMASSDSGDMTELFPALVQSALGERSAALVEAIKSALLADVQQSATLMTALTSTPDLWPLLLKSEAITGILAGYLANYEKHLYLLPLLSAMYSANLLDPATRYSHASIYSMEVDAAVGALVGIGERPPYHPDSLETILVELLRETVPSPNPLSASLVLALPSTFELTPHVTAVLTQAAETPGLPDLIYSLLIARDVHGPSIPLLNIVVPRRRSRAAIPPAVVAAMLGGPSSSSSSSSSTAQSTAQNYLAMLALLEAQSNIASVMYYIPAIVSAAADYGSPVAGGANSTAPIQRPFIANTAVKILKALRAQLVSASLSSSSSTPASASLAMATEIVAAWRIASAPLAATAVSGSVAATRANGRGGGGGDTRPAQLLLATATPVAEFDALVGARLRALANRTLDLASRALILEAADEVCAGGS